MPQCFIIFIYNLDINTCLITFVANLIGPITILWTVFIGVVLLNLSYLKDLITQIDRLEFWEVKLLICFQRC